MKAFIFPGQASQFEGMGRDLYEENDTAKSLMEKANDVLGFRITDIMFSGSAEELKQTKVTQPSVFLYSVVKALIAGDQFQPDVVAGHSLGEFSALTSCRALSFEDGLRLVAARSSAMQKACEIVPSTMAAIIGLDDGIVENICSAIEELVVPANYNCPGQLVISGSIRGVELACAQLLEAGARRAMKLSVGGAFHSPLMEPAKTELMQAIESTTFKTPICPIYQNVDGKPHSDPETIKKHLIDQLTNPVLWTLTMQNMIADGVNEFVEVGGKVLSGLVKKVDRKMPTNQL
jgi:[acyl-carrier-protein] S-malonyltransferase